MPENTTDLEAEARDEAEKRYERSTLATCPTWQRRTSTFASGFINGAMWSARRPFTDAEVEAAARAIYAMPTAAGDAGGWEVDSQKTRDDFIAEARAALDAVTKVWSET